MAYRKKGIKPSEQGSNGVVAKVVSVKDTPPDAVEKLLLEIADLKAQLKVSDAARSEAERAALDAAQAQGTLLQTEVQEVPTGKKIKVKRANGYKVVGHKEDGRDILRPIWKTVALPTFFYKIDMPPCGGTDFKINGVPFYHGTVYEFDEDTLRSVKEIVYRLWDHDRQIHGSDENFYRKPQKTRLSGRGMSA